MGVLSALPLVAIGNACCCLWVLSGGLVAAYVFQQNQSAPITPGDGALVGLLAGLIGSVVYVFVSIPVSIVIGPFERALMQRIIDMAGTMPPEMRDTIERYGREGRESAAFFVVGRIFAFIFFLFLGAIFSTLGGLLGAAVFRKQPPPPGPIDIPPPPPIDIPPIS